MLPGTDDVEKLGVIMASVRELDKQPIEKIMDVVKNRFALPEHLLQEATRVVCVAASLAIMAEIQITAPVAISPDSVTIWAAGSSLMDNVREIYQRSSVLKDLSINRALTISNLARYNKCRVDWTDRLDKHLDYRVSRGSRVISIFQHKIWLSAHLNQEKYCVIPQEILCEAIDTLNLLLPHNNRDTETFLRKRDQRIYSLGWYGRERKLNLKDYPHWGPKIEKLIDVFEGPRSGIWRFLPRHDKSDLLESANFWIATTAALFAFVGFILGLTSIIYAKLSYDIGIKSVIISEESLELTKLQYQLSLAQACSDPNEARLLPDFCSAEE
ncbi:hypothetical protein CTAM01_01095 [Colletotrichum tamarilloi]|uniref:Uncharacterized protein n=1 Tax=Colletotrichum tamarilloi TaxID=1209934 RepID=A0ABQ9RTS2_9PEZI|nr:uncharacterized protein CTAM01_01095 [Colletotrichum tamarilloi]KAK1512165.1 hypothetical protein CTAM01_01095 [Colletotrichum tamarilloi]